MVRDRVVADWAGTLGRGTRVLDVGAGSMRYAPLFEHCEYIAQDHPSVTYATPDARLIRSDITRIPLDAGSLDAILCTEVLEHVERPLDAIEEFARLLRVGGQLFLSVPAACRVHRVPTHYYGGYAPDFFELSIPARGFRLDRLEPLGNWSEFMAQELGRLPTVLRDHTTLPKPARYAAAALAWPWFRIVVPSLLIALGRLDTSTDFPMGWFAYATRVEGPMPSA